MIQIEHNVEDCVMYLAGEGPYLFNSCARLGRFDIPVAQSIGRQLSNNKAFTEKQSAIGLRLVQKYRAQLKDAGFEVDRILDESIFKWPFRTIEKIKKLYLQDDKLVVKSHFISEIINSFKKKKDNHYTTGNYNPETKEWSFDYNEDNLLYLVKLCSTHKFDIDQEILDKYQQCVDILQDPTKYIQSYEPASNEKHIARKECMEQKLKGNTLFSDSVERLLGDPIDCIIKQDHQGWFVNSFKYDFENVCDLIRSVDKTVIFCPLHQEDIFKQLVEDLVAYELNTATSICLRFKGDNPLNNLIKANEMNNFDPDNKIFVVNNKLPKTVVKAGVHADLAVLLQSVTPSHHKTQHWLSGLPVVLYYTDSKPTEGHGTCQLVDL